MKLNEEAYSDIVDWYILFSKSLYSSIPLLRVHVLCCAAHSVFSTEYTSIDCHLFYPGYVPNIYFTKVLQYRYNHSIDLHPWRWDTHL